MQQAPILCAVLDVASLGLDPEQFARALFRGGVDWIQLRDRSAASDRLLEVARGLILARDGDAPNKSARRVIINRRVDVALAAGADGVHLGFDALAPATARGLLGADALIGISCHSIEEIRAADDNAISYAHLAPIWDPLSKPASRPALGAAYLRKAAREGIPLLAQGGIESQRVAEAVGAGAVGVAVTGTVAASRDPFEAARALREALDRARGPQ